MPRCRSTRTNDLKKKIERGPAKPIQGSSRKAYGRLFFFSVYESIGRGPGALITKPFILQLAIRLNPKVTVVLDTVSQQQHQRVVPSIVTLVYYKFIIQGYQHFI